MGFSFPTVALPLAVGFLGLQLHGIESKVVNKTLYRITPRNYTGITNLDTGDAAGDSFFGLYEMSAPVVCNHSGSESGASGLLCANDPLLQIPGFNVYIQVQVGREERVGC